MGDSDTGRTYASKRYTRQAALFVGAVPALFCLLFLLGQLRRPASGAGRDVAIGIFAAAFCAFAGVAARFARLAVAATPSHLTVRNFWSTRRIPWQDIEAIEPPRPLKAGPHSRYGSTGTGLKISLCDGSVILANAFARHTGDPEDFADAVVEELRQAMSSHRKAPSGS